MSSDGVKPETEELAALAALGFALPAEQATVPAATLREAHEAVALLGESAPSVKPEPSVKNRLMSLVAAWESLKPIADVRPYDGDWATTGVRGVDCRNLFHDKHTRRITQLIRMEPGARIPAHIHHDDEQCYVLKGDIGWGELVYREGDFVVMGKGTCHPEIKTVEGNLLLIVCGHNEVVTA